jgi:uncharacterized protein YyaL (SSP411 family)
LEGLGNVAVSPGYSGAHPLLGESEFGTVTYGYVEAAMRTWALLLALSMSHAASAQDEPVQSGAQAIPAASGDSARIHWLSWNDEVFARAKRENKFVLLDLEAVWCHWCHVMDETTYRDPEVRRLMQSRYLAVKVDQDSRPDLSNRYEDYGWPATVVFDGNGQEIVKRQGYLQPKQFASILQAIIDDPTPGPSVEPEKAITFPTNPLLSDKLRQEVRANYLAGYDAKEGAWGSDFKFMDCDSVEYAMVTGSRGDAQAEKMARQTLTAQLNLLDPVWGGVYQYSTDGLWTKPHFEKIMSMQAEDLRVYAQAYALYHDPAYLHAAQSIDKFLTDFLLSPGGAFYTSQDADVIEGQHSAEYFKLDDAGRRKQGVPRVDKHSYARENGWAIAGAAALYSATGDPQYLDQAKRAAIWVRENRSLPGGGFTHDAKDAAGPYLGDNVAMARAFVALYGATGDRQWLVYAERTMAYIEKNFKSPVAGYLTSAHATDSHAKLHPQRDENVMLARTANLLSHFTARPVYKFMTDQAMRYLAASETARRLPAASVLLADYEIVRAPLHITVVGAKDDPAAQALFQAGLRYPSGYKRLEWWDVKEGALPNPDVQYPALQHSAVFVCTDRTCSPPIFKPEDLQAKVDRLSRAVASASANLSGAASH